MPPIVLCDDGSEPAANAIRDAAPLLSGREAIVVYVWQSLGAYPLANIGGGLAGFPDDADQRIAVAAQEAAEHGAERAREAGFDATPLAVQAIGPVWQAIVDVADEHDAALIVIGARGLGGVQRALLGSVSEKVARHADRPVLVVHPRA
jgi:nucleotide-binding universal stress UspA family protein